MIDGILSDMNDMSAETACQLLSAAFTRYIMHQEKCGPKEAMDRMAIICDLTQKSIASSIMQAVC